MPACPLWSCHTALFVDLCRLSVRGLPRGLVPEAYAAFERLTALRSRREYSAQLQTLEEAVADVLSCGTTFRSCRHVLTDMVRLTYQERCLHQLL